MPRLIDLSGRQFGRLTVAHYVGQSMWHCVCVCGIEKPIHSVGLLHGGTQSCGCLPREVVRERSLKHGQAPRGGHTNIYRRWEHMKQRCSNPNDRDYPRYGGRGISVCARWQVGDGTKTGFECFLADMGMPPNRSYSIDRIDVNGPYSPENCRWATAKQQANNRTSTRILTIDGVSKPLSEWCEQYKIGSKTVLFRLKHRGMDHKDAVTSPLVWTKSIRN